MESQKNYTIHVLIRPECTGPESTYELMVRALDETTARRKVLEVIWSRGALVTEFLSVEQQKRKSR